MLQDGFDTTKSLDDIGPVGVQVPQLSVVSGTRPPEWIALHQRILFELGSGSETLVEAQCTPVLLEESVDTRQTSIPAVLKIFERKSPVLLICFQSLLRIFGPHALRVNELRFPSRHISYLEQLASCVSWEGDKDLRKILGIKVSSSCVIPAR